jgi:3-phenylpropionate/trans-cinnamate dioxygenase ferredoxin reductase subunit
MHSTAARPAIASTASTAMPAERIAIVGAGPAGLATARAYRGAGGRGKVTMIGEEPYLPYERPPLSKEFLRGEIDARELPIEPERWYREHDVELRMPARVRSIDPGAGTVELDDEDGPLVQADAIVLATGSEPLRELVAGAEHPGVMTFRTIDDSERLRAREPAAQPIVVIGTGFIGCELAASLSMCGQPVVLLGEDELPQQQRLGGPAAARIAGWLAELDVELIGGTEVAAIHDAAEVELGDGRRLEASAVVLGIGVRPRAELAATAGLEVRDGAITVDSSMRCRDAPGGEVLAVGDVAFAHNETAGRDLRVEHWGDALGHGEVAGRTLAGERCRWDSVPGFWSTIGRNTLKYSAWGDGYDECRLDEGEDGAFTAWYGRDGAVVGVLTHERDEDYERGRELISERAPLP